MSALMVFMVTNLKTAKYDILVVKIHGNTKCWLISKGFIKIKIKMFAFFDDLFLYLWEEI